MSKFAVAWTQVMRRSTATCCRRCRSCTCQTGATQRCTQSMSTAQEAAMAFPITVLDAASALQSACHGCYEAPLGGLSESKVGQEGPCGHYLIPWRAGHPLSLCNWLCSYSFGHIHLLDNDLQTTDATPPQFTQQVLHRFHADD